MGSLYHLLCYSTVLSGATKLFQNASDDLLTLKLHLFHCFCEGYITFYENIVFIVK